MSFGKTLVLKERIFQFKRVTVGLGYNDIPELKSYTRAQNVKTLDRSESYSDASSQIVLHNF